MASSSTTAMDATSSYHPNAFFSSTSASIAPNTSSSSTSNSFPNPPSISVSSSSATKVSHFQGSFDRPSVLPPMGPLSDFPDMDNVMAQVRSFLDRSGASKHVANEPRFMSVEPEESDGAAGSRARTLEGDFGDQNHLQEPPESSSTRFGWRSATPVRSWGDHLPPSQPWPSAVPANDGMDLDASDVGYDEDYGKQSTPFTGGSYQPSSTVPMAYHDHLRTSPDSFPLIAGAGLLAGLGVGRGVEFADMEGDEDAAENAEDTPTDPTHFLYSVLVNCLNGLRSINDNARTMEVARALSVCRMGLEYISIIDNGVARNEVQNRYMMLAAASAPPPLPVSGTGKGKGRKTGGRAKHHKAHTGGRSLNLPAEILLRVFSFLSEPDQSGAQPTAATAQQTAQTMATLGPVPASALYSCSLVCRQWDVQASTELWKRVTMDDDAPRLSRFVVSLSSTALSGRNRGSLVRVISIACTDAELSLLALAATKLPGLHSLELRRSFIPNASSYRLLNRLRLRFPSLRSLVADMIPPTALSDIISIVRGATLLSNLHVSVGPPDHRVLPPGIGSPPPETIQSLLWKIPNLRSISFWRVSLPRDEGLWVPALASSCPSLKAIRIDDCGDISMDILVGLWRRCDLLECISMRKVKRRTAFTELVPRQSMKRVVLDGCWMNDSLCAAIGRNAPNLEIFYIEDDWADDDFKHPLAPTVVNELTDAGVLELARYQHNLRAITFIGFPGRRNFRASSLRQLLDSNPSCFALNLARMDPQWPYRMSDSWLLELSPSLRNIEILELYIQNGITEDGLLETLRRAAIASSLSPRSLPGVGGPQMQQPVVDVDAAIATCDPSFVGMGRMRRLGLSGWSQVSDRSLFCLPMLCPRLERLDMAGANVTPAGLQSLVDAAGRLRECVVTVPPTDSGDGFDEVGDESADASGVGVGGVRWGNVMQYDDPVSEDVFSPYSVWEREVRRLGRRDGIIY